MEKIKLVTVLLALCLTLTGSIYSQSKGGRANDVYENATYLSQSTPGQMDAGKTYGVSVTMKNTGRSTWYKGSYALKLISVPESSINVWGVSKIDVNSSVSSGEEVVFNFTVTAPDAGGYNLQWQMANGNAYFGEPTISAPVTVSGSTSIGYKPENNNAVFTAQNVPTEMDVEHIYTLSYTAKNTGANTWNPSEYKLKVTVNATTASDNNIWLVPNVGLPNEVAPGGEVTFTFNVTAWNSDGTYNFLAQLMQNITPFGQASTPVSVNVH
jgi:hypothetical protein